MTTFDHEHPIATMATTFNHESQIIYTGDTINHVPNTTNDLRTFIWELNQFIPTYFHHVVLKQENLHPRTINQHMAHNHRGSTHKKNYMKATTSWNIAQASHIKILTNTTLSAYHSRVRFCPGSLESLISNNTHGNRDLEIWNEMSISQSSTTFFYVKKT